MDKNIAHKDKKYPGALLHVIKIGGLGRKLGASGFSHSV